MKSFIKLKCTNIVLLLIAMLSVTNNGVNEENITNYIKDDSLSVANYIENNFELFVEKYNEASDDKLNATYIEKSFYVKIIDHEGEQNGYFLDFDHNNGYALIGNEYIIYDFSTNLDSPFKDIVSNEFFYSTSRGYLYFKDGEYVNADDEKNMNKECLDNFTFENGTYSGQEPNKSGCGYINNTDLYVRNKYGSNWKLYSSKSLTMTKGELTTQTRLSCYYNYSYHGNELWYSSEGNCFFVSAYNILQSLADATGSYRSKVDKYKTNFSKGPMPKINEFASYNAKENEYDIYKTIYDDRGNNISGKIVSSNGATCYRKELVNSVFPKLYVDTRKYVISKYKKISGGTVYDTADIINAVEKQYGYDFKARGTVAAGLYGSSGIKAINKGFPFGLCTSVASNGGYGNHIMAGCGYKVYSKTTGWWIFKMTSYKYFYELRDGHGDDIRYFDLSNWIGFGGIILLDFQFFY